MRDDGEVDDVSLELPQPFFGELLLCSSHVPSKVAASISCRKCGASLLLLRTLNERNVSFLIYGLLSFSDMGFNN